MGIRAAETINRLVRVANHKQRFSLTTPSHDQTILQFINILEFIDQQMCELRINSSRFTPFQNPQQQVVEITSVDRLQALRIEGESVRIKIRFGCAVFLSGNRLEKPLGRLLAVAFLQNFSCDNLRFFLINERNVFQQMQTKRMEGAYMHRFCRCASQNLFQTLTHLCRCFIGKGYRRDIGRLYAFFLYHVLNTRHQRFGFARARAGDNSRNSSCTLHRLLLFGIRLFGFVQRYGRHLFFLFDGSRFLCLRFPVNGRLPRKKAKLSAKLFPFLFAEDLHTAVFPVKAGRQMHLPLSYPTDSFCNAYTGSRLNFIERNTAKYIELRAECIKHLFILRHRTLTCSAGAGRCSDHLR